MNSIRKLTIGVLILLVAIAAVVLYQGGNEPASKAQTSLTAVTDGVGRMVIVPEHPQRVVALNASNVDLYYAAGGTLVGRPLSDALAPELAEKVKAIPVVGSPPNPNVEQIIALKPDLVIGADTPFHHSLIPILEKAKIPILIQRLDNYQQIVDTLLLFGKLTGQTQQAADVVAAIESQLQAAINKHKDKPAPKVLIIWGSSESFNMATPNSFVGDLVRRLGAVNVATGQDAISGNTNYVPLSLEVVAKADPDAILLITHSSEEKVSEKFRKELAEHPAWQGMRAVRENKVYKLPYQLFAVNPGTRVGLAIEHLAGLLYPGVE